ncbi:MAG: hypothetical protein ACRCT7_05765 [Shewanella sp.]
MGFFSKWFDADKSSNSSDSANHPVNTAAIERLYQLNRQDMITLDNGFGLPPMVRGQTLMLEHVYCDEYQYRLEAVYWFKTKQDQTLRLVEHKDKLLLCLPLTRAQVEQIFDLDEFSYLFAIDSHAALTPLTTAFASDLSAWLGQQYHRVHFAEFGYRHQQDYRQRTPPQSDDRQGGQAFESYYLETSDEQHALLIQVMTSGDTDVYLAMARPMTDIHEFWPRGNP